MALFRFAATRLAKLADLLAEGSATVSPAYRYAPGFICTMQTQTIAAAARTPKARRVAA